MTYIATVTSKRQLTLPVALFSKLDLSKGRKILVTGDRGKIILSPVGSIVDELAGVIKSDVAMSDDQLEKMIGRARKKRFDNRK